MTRSHDRDERGAVAILFAVSALILFVIAGMIVDLGLARDNKRLSQASSDAAALAAANVLWPSGTCTSPANSAPPCFVDAVAAAKNYAEKNYAVSASEWATCPTPPTGFTAYDSSLKCVSFDNLTSAVSRIWFLMPTRSVRTSLGGLADVTSVPIGSRAQVGITRDSGTPGNLRPWALCAGSVGTSGNVVFVPLKNGVANKGPAYPCGTNAPPGGWWVAQCTGQSNSTNATENAVANGCSESHNPVPGQPNTTAQALTDYLENYCPARAANATCLSSDPGNNFLLSQDEWQDLVGQSFLMPVICSPASSPPNCTELTVTAQGNNASYPIQRIATVTLCGFKMSAPSTNWPSTGYCATNNPLNYAPSDITAGSGFFVVITALTGGNQPDFNLTPATTALTK